MEKLGGIFARQGAFVMIEKTVFGHLPSGEQVDLYTITNSRGAGVSLQISAKSRLVRFLRTPQ